MFGVSVQAADMLKKNLLESCSQAEFGFRLTATGDSRDRTAARIRMDFVRGTDRVFNANGIKILVGPESLEKVADLQLDYDESADSGFVLKPRSQNSG